MIYESFEIDDILFIGGGWENIWVTQMSVLVSSLL
jgi:hypothetical protein